MLTRREAPTSAALVDAQAGGGSSSRGSGWSEGSRNTRAAGNLSSSRSPPFPYPSPRSVMHRRLLALCTVLCAPLAPPILAQRATAPVAAATPTLDTTSFRELRWRSIGPFRGGRAAAGAGIPTQPLTYFAGYTGGGLWRTDDAGINWRNISDGWFRTGSIGAIAIAPSDPNVIYVGSGEPAVRLTIQVRSASPRRTRGPASRLRSGPSSTVIIIPWGHPRLTPRPPRELLAE